MKRIVKVLLTVLLAVTFILPTAAMIRATDVPVIDTLTSAGFINVDATKKYVTFSGSALPMDVSYFKELLVQKETDERKIVAYSAEDVKYEDEENDILKTGDRIKIEFANGELIKEYRFILKGDVNKDGYVNDEDSALVVDYQKGIEPFDAYSIAAIFKDNSVNVHVSGDDNIATGAGDYSAVVSFGSANLTTTVSYIEFTLQYPTFFIYSDHSKPSDMDDWDVEIEDLGSFKLKITAQKKDDFNGAVFDNANSPKKKLINLEFTLLASTLSGTEGSFKTLSGGKGVSNRGGTVGIGGIEKFVTVGTALPIEPTLNTKSETSITINSVMGYQYYCSTSSEMPAANAQWTTAGGATVTFSFLAPGTTYYIFYRRSATEFAYLMEDSIDTYYPTTLQGPSIEASDKTSITVDFGANFTGIYFSNNSRAPGTNSSWIYLSSINGAISGIGSYAVNQLEGTVTFSGLAPGRYFIYGKTDDDTISDVTVWAPTPNLGSNDVSVTKDSILLPYVAIYKYSLDGVNYFGASVKTNMTTNGSIYIQREVVNGDPNVAVIHGLNNNTNYNVYVKVFNETAVASDACVLTIKTGESTPEAPPAPVPKSRSQIYIAIEYNKKLVYRINNSNWTSPFTVTYPTINNVINLGSFGYYFDDATAPTYIIFTKLTPDTSYKFDAKFVEAEANTTNISSVTTSTLVCNHVYGEKVYVGDTLNYSQTCKICGKVITGTDKPTHTHTYVTMTVPSTCTTAGHTYQECSGCHEILAGSYIELPLAAHTETIRPKTHATCTQYGTYDIVCAVCGEVIRRDELNKNDPPVGHSYETVTEYLSPTCTEAGHEEIYQKCTICGDEIPVSERDIDALGHDAEWAVTIEATATAEGKRVFICKRCGEVLDIEVIPRLIDYKKNANGTGTYTITSDTEQILVTDAAKLAIADGDASVKLVFSDAVEVELDPAMTVGFLRNGSYLKVRKVTNPVDASGDLAKAGFDLNKVSVYEITAQNAVIANGKATVTIKYNATADGGAVNVYFVDAQGKKTKMTSRYENGTLTFETTHFSTYVVEQGKTKGSNTGLIIAIIAIAAVLLATGGTFGYMVYTSKKTKKRKFNF